MSETDFASLIIPVATALWGDPNKAMSSKTETRWGSGGSKAVEIAKGAWFDHEAGKGGNVIELVMHENGCDKPTAIGWLESNGFIPKRDSGHRDSPGRQEAPKPSNEPAEPQQPSAATCGDIIDVETDHYDYTDRDGAFQYRVIRYEKRYADGRPVIDDKTGNPKKTFKQKSRDASGAISWGLNGRAPCLYRWPLIEQAAEAGRVCFIVEGEKDVHTLEAFGLDATTNSGGAQNWRPEFSASFQAAQVVVLIDNDEAGRERGKVISELLTGVAASVKVIDLARYWKDAPSKSDVTDWVKAGGTKEALIDIVEGRARPLPPVSTFGAQTSGAIHNKPVIYDWLVKHLIERSGILIIAGESMAGKSFLVMDMGMKVARGLDYAGHKVRQGAVIHMAVEDGKGTELRHKGYRKANGIGPDQDVPYVIMDPFANNGLGFSLMDDAQVDKFIAECLDWKEFYGSLEMIIIDTLAMATEGMDENSSGEASKVLGRVNRIRERTGATVAVVHHMNAGGTKVRGSTAIVANVPNVIELRQQMIPAPNRHTDPKPALDGLGRPIRRARLAKNKNGSANKSWAFVLEEVKLDELDEDGEPFVTMVCARPAKHSNHDTPEQETRLVGDQKLVLDALTAAQADRGISLPDGVNAGSVSKCVAANDFVAAVRKRMSFKAPDEEQEARQKELADMLKRTTTALINAGYMGRDNDLKIVWWTGKSDRPRPRYQEQERPPEQPGAGIPEEVRREIMAGDPPF